MSISAPARIDIDRAVHVHANLLSVPFAACSRVPYMDEAVIAHRSGGAQAPAVIEAVDEGRRLVDVLVPWHLLNDAEAG